MYMETLSTEDFSFKRYGTNLCYSLYKHIMTRGTLPGLKELGMLVVVLGIRKYWIVFFSNPLVISKNTGINSISHYPGMCIPV